MTDLNCDYIKDGKFCATFFAQEYLEKDWKCDCNNYKDCEGYLLENKGKSSEKKGLEKKVVLKI